MKQQLVPRASAPRRDRSRLRVFSAFAVGILTGVFLLAGCGEMKEYHDPGLDISVKQLDPQLENRWGTRGVVVTKTPPNSELTDGDLVTHLVSRTEVSNREELIALLRRAMGPHKRFWNIGRTETSDATAVLEIERDGKTLYIEFSARVPSRWKDSGATFQGTTITSVSKGYEDSPSPSPAAASGLKKGDRVIAVIDEDAVSSVEEFKAAANRAKRATNFYVYTHELSGIKLEAITVLGELGGSNPQVLSRLLEILATSPDPATRRTVASALQSLAPHQKSDQLLRAMLGRLRESAEPDAEIRRSAATILQTLAGQMPDAFDEAGIRTVAAAMNDPDPGVHFKAGIILSQFGQRSIPVLIDAVGEGNPVRVRDIAATSLGDIGGTRARDALVQALRQTSDVPLQLTIATSLSRIGDSQALKELRALLGRTTNSGVREFVRQLLETESTPALSRR